MLVLSRKKDEALCINNDIVVTVVAVRGDKVRIGIEAPKEVPVYRGEVYEQIRREFRKEQFSEGRVATEAEPSGSPAPGGLTLEFKWEQ